MEKNKILKILLFIIFFLTSFLLGALSSDKIKKIDVKNSENFSLSSLYKKNDIWKNVKKEKDEDKINENEKIKYSDSFFWKILDSDLKDLDLSEYWKAYNIIRKNYYNIDKVKKSDLVYWSIKWLVWAIWDKHSVFMTPKETKRFEEVLSWEFQWIWAVVKKVELWVEIEQVLKWAPAQKAWLKAWDIIIKANKKELINLDIASAVELIKWPAWTKVELVILRSGEKDFITKEVIREKVEIPSVESKILEDNIWYIAINTFWVTTALDFSKELNNLKKKKIKWLIIDLRDNWWGYLISAVDILSHFIEKGKIVVSIKYRDKSKEEKYFSKPEIEKENYKIVILINWNTASASEITSLWLREYNKAILVWEKSYWKWSVQEQFTNFKDWATLKLTIANWFTPKWNNIDWKWIIPDIEVKFKKEDYDYNECKKIWKCKNIKEKDFKLYDRQLEVAKKVLKEFIKNWFIQNTIDEFKKEEKK